MSQLLDVENVEVDYQGKIFTTDSRYFGRTKIGYVDSAGNIYDMRERKPLKIGYIDSRGTIAGSEMRDRLLESRY